MTSRKTALHPFPPYPPCSLSHQTPKTETDHITPSLSLLSIPLPHLPIRRHHNLLGSCRPTVLGNDPPGVNDTGDPAEDGEANVDEKVGAAAGLEEDGDGGQEEGEEVQEDVGC